MNLSRRGFLKSSLVICAAPLVVRAESLMSVWTPPKALILPKTTGQIWNLGPNMEGGYMYSAELSRVLRESIRPLSHVVNDEVMDGPAFAIMSLNSQTTGIPTLKRIGYENIKA